LSETVLANEHHKVHKVSACVPTLVAAMSVATGTEERADGSPACSSRDDAATPDPAAVAGALPPEVLQILMPRTVNEEGELEDLPPLPPPSLAPVFSKENLDALRAERVARRTAAAAAPGGSARPSTKPGGDADATHAKPAHSHRAKAVGFGTARSASSPPGSASEPTRKKGGLKSNRKSKLSKESSKEYLTMSRATPTIAEAA
jgi:hypothetical protein